MVVAALLVALALALELDAAEAATRIPARCQPPVPTTRYVMRLCAIHFHHHRTNRLRRQAGRPRLPYAGVAERYPARARRVLTYWVAAQERAAILLQQPPWLSGSWYHAALCVHSHEGSWRDTTPTYMGGMQFDAGTWTANGGSGNPGSASISEQLHVAYRTWLRRGWEPWPNTARICGLR